MCGPHWHIAHTKVREYRSANSEVVKIQGMDYNSQTQLYIYIYIYPQPLQRCKRWGSHNAVKVGMSGSTS